MAILCNQDPNQPRTTNPPSQFFLSQAAMGTATCPDGTVFTYVVPAGTFVSFSQIMADRIATSYANDQAKKRMICLSALSPTECCVNQPYSATIVATGNPVANLPVNLWQVTPFSLPEGMDLNGGFFLAGSSVVLAGTPTESGTFVFTIRITTPTGEYMEKVYSLCVIGIDPASLPGGTEGSAYSQALSATACAAPALSWQVASGSLPGGLTLDEQTGIISGTPTVAGTFTFEVSIQTQAT